MPDKAGHAVLRHLAESNQDSTLAACGACTRRKPYKTAALSEVFSSLVPFRFIPSESAFSCVHAPQAANSLACVPHSIQQINREKHQLPSRIPNISQNNLA